MLFKKNKDTKSGQIKAALQHKAAKKIAGAIIILQSKLCDKINKHLSGIGVEKLKLILLVFLMVACGNSIYLISKSVTNYRKADHLYNTGRLSIPVNFHAGGNGLKISETYIDTQSFSKMELLKNYLDSLKYSDKKLYDSIISSRPFLLDTISLLETIYYSQKQK